MQHCNSTILQLNKQTNKKVHSSLECFLKDTMGEWVLQVIGIDSLKTQLVKFSQGTTR